MQRFLLGSAALAALCLSLPSVSDPTEAQTWVEPKTRVVSLRDLDLSDPRQVAVGRQRIGSAVAYVCDAPLDAVAMQTDGCVGDTWSAANAQLDKLRHRTRGHVQTTFEAVPRARR